MDPERTEAQAEALLATRRILARLKLELLESGEDLAGELTEEDHGPGGSAAGDEGEASRRVEATLTLDRPSKREVRALSRLELEYGTCAPQISRRRYVLR